jgi:hypothetical protein
LPDVSIPNSQLTDKDGNGTPPLIRWMNAVRASLVAAVGGTIATQDEGISVDTDATTLNFVGAGVTATDAGAGVTTVTIPGGGTIADGDYGDITVSGSGTVWNIDAGVVGPTELADTAVAAGSYGDSLTVGEFTVDSDGRLTAAADVAIATMVGDSGAGGVKGLVPAPAAGDAAASKFLKADGTWAAGGSGAPVGAQYVVMALDGTLTNERRLQATTPIVLTDGGANADATLTHATVGTAGTYGSTSAVPVITTNATGHVTAASTTPVSLGYAAVDFFGSGEDGAVTLDGAVTPAWATRSGSSYTLTRSPVCTDLTVDVGVRLFCNNINVFANGTLTNNGTIDNNGLSATGVLGAAFVGAQFWAQTQQGDGGAGTTDPGSAANITNSIGGAGGSGGSSPSGAGGTGGTVTIPNAGAGGIAHCSTVFAAWMARCNGSGIFVGGSGGGGARGDAGGAGAGGGAGGGCLAVFANQLAGNGTISCNGGGGGVPAVACVNGGGGGGGGGGALWVITRTENPGSVNTITASGGVGSAGKGSGTSGSDGSDGRVFLIRVAT